MRFIKKIVERGNVTIPSDVREALEIDEGDIVEFEIVSIVKKTGREAPADDDKRTPSDDRSPSSSSSPRPNSTAIQSPRGNAQ